MNAIRDRRVRLSLVSGGGLLVLVGILLFANLLADRFFVRLDWTADGRYSLSRASRRLVRSLEDPVHVRFYLTPGLPQPYESHGRYVRDLLQEYRTAGRGKLEYEIVSPGQADDLRMELNRLGIQSVRFTQVGSDQFQVREGYIALALNYQDKQEVIPFVKDVDSLEYDISSRLRGMTQKEKKTLLFISNHNEVSTSQLEEGRFGRYLEEFKLESGSLTTPDPAVKPQAVFVLGPKNQLQPEEIKALDNHISSGTPVVIALNRRMIYPQSFRSMAQTTGLEPFLEHYGVKMERDFVLDEQAQNIAMQSRETVFYVRYWPFLVSNNLNKSQVALRGLDGLGFPYAHPLSPSFTDPSPLKFTWLAKSSQRSWIWPDLSDLDPPSLFSRGETDKPTQWGPYTLAALVEGSTVTFSEPRRPVDNLRLIVLGTAYVFDPAMPNPETNGVFLQTLAQWATQEGDILAIPPKGSPFRPLKPVPAWARLAFKFMGYFVIPAIVILGGLLRWRRRRGLREDVRRAFAQKGVPGAQVA